MGNPEFENFYICVICSKKLRSNNYSSHIQKVCGKNKSEVERAELRYAGKRRLARFSYFQVFAPFWYKIKFLDTECMMSLVWEWE